MPRTLGSTIQNSRNISLNTQANLKNFYNKVPFLKEINNKRRPRPQDREVSNEKKDGFGNVIEEEEKEKREINPLEHILRFVMGLHNVSGTYARNEGSMLPGYAFRSRYAGFNNDFTPGLPFLLDRNTRTCTATALARQPLPTRRRKTAGCWSRQPEQPVH